MIFYEETEKVTDNPEKIGRIAGGDDNVCTIDYHDQWHINNQANNTYLELDFQPREFEIKDIEEQYFL